MRPVTTVFARQPVTIFAQMSALSNECGAVNLGQGFPDDRGPDGIIEAAATYLWEGNNQYPPASGIPPLREAIARHEADYWGLARDPAGEVLVTSGATEALAAALLGLVGPGEEVIIFEPAYDAYAPLIEAAGGVPVAVRLKAPDWALDVDRLRQAAGPRTRAILVNDPQNPAAKVFTRAELEAIAEAAEASDAVLICDEVYEHLAFDGRPHLPLAALEGVGARTLKIGSAGKIFSLTGWKVGWITGPADLVALCGKAHQFLTFTTPPNLQAGIAWGLDHARDWIDSLKSDMKSRRDHLVSSLTKAGFRPLPAEGTYFVNLDLRDTRWAGQDRAFCTWLTREVGVAAIPLSPFYLEDPETNIARLCFAKNRSVLDEAVARLEANA